VAGVVGVEAAVAALPAPHYLAAANKGVAERPKRAAAAAAAVVVAVALRLAEARAAAAVAAAVAEVAAEVVTGLETGLHWRLSKNDARRWLTSANRAAR
jgi:hypothetical protein